MIRPRVQIVRIDDNALLPSYAHATDSGADLFSTHDEELPPMGHKLIHTGIKVALPEGYEAQVRSKSGRALNEGLFVLNSPGTIDNEYRGEICVILYNASYERRFIKKGEKVAQLVVTPYVQASFDEVSELRNTERNAGGFGSTGLDRSKETFTEPANRTELRTGWPFSAREDTKAWPFAEAGYDNNDGRQIERRPDF